MVISTNVNAIFLLVIVFSRVFVGLYFQILLWKPNEKVSVENYTQKKEKLILVTQKKGKGKERVI